MRREQRGDEADGLHLSKRLVHLQQSRLVLDVEAVPGLGLHRRYAESHHLG